MSRLPLHRRIDEAERGRAPMPRKMVMDPPPEPLRVVVVHYADHVTSYLPRARRKAFELLSELLETADERRVMRIDVLTPDHAKTVIEADFVNHTYRISPDEEMPLDEENPDVT